jgi:hypothetical protein
VLPRPPSFTSHRSYLTVRVCASCTAATHRARPASLFPL